MSSRTDRIIIAIALLILLLTLGGLAGFDRLLEKEDRTASESQAIGQIVEGRGDVRVKFNDEVRWQKSRTKQKLLLNDSIFSGENSHVDLAIGESRLKLESNTLVVLRKDSLFKSLNLDYGALNGILAKNDNLIIETSQGEKIELKADVATKISIQKRGGKTSVKVIEGNAKVTKEGHVQNLTSRDAVVFEEKAKFDPLVFVSPTSSLRYSFSDKEAMRFAWRYQSREANPGDHFVFEFASNSNFNQLVMREELSGQNEISPNLKFPQELYYRVKDRAGNFSEIRRVQLLRPRVPVILAPKDGEILDVVKGQNYPVDMRLTTFQPESKVILQMSTQADFAQVMEARTLLEPKTHLDLGIGDYYFRARAEFKQMQLDGSPLSTDWSPVTRVSVREKLDPVSFDQVRLSSIVVIPNIDYPKNLYSSAPAVVGEYLKSTQNFPSYFKNLLRSGHQLMVSRHRPGESPLAVDEGQFPAAWLEPGTQTLTYQLQTRGVASSNAKSHTMRIEMEPPKDLRADDNGRLSWTPILFAKGYEGELRNQLGGVRQFKSPRAQHLAQLQKGLGYSYRVRALNGQGRPISGWSPPASFELALPPAPEVVPLAEEPAPVERKVAAEEAPNTNTLKIGETIKRAWEKVGYWLWLGSGFNFFDVRQTVSNQADVSYQNTKGPSMFAEIGYMARNLFGIVTSFKRTPGEVRIDNYPVNNPEFNWDTVSLEALYGLPYTGQFLSQTLNWGVRAGVQRHSFPFLFIGSGQTVVNSQSEMLTGSLGFFMETVGRWKQHWYMRYQQPISSSTSGGNSLEITPILAFDGGLGTSYMLTQRLKTGLFWYGQWHNYDFTYRSGTDNNTGSQSLFYSNMELRLGLDF